MSGLVVEATLERPGYLRVVVTGLFDRDGGGTFVASLSEALLSDVRCVVVDLARIEHLDSDGLRLLVQARALLQAAGVECSLVGAPPLLEHLLALLTIGDTDTPPGTEDSPSSF